jgi:hypothetical protein
VTVPEGVRVNDRVVRMVQEQTGRILRGAQHRAEMVAGSWRLGQPTPASARQPNGTPSAKRSSMADPAV